MGVNIELMTELGLKKGGYREDLGGIWLKWVRCLEMRVPFDEGGFSQ